MVYDGGSDVGYAELYLSGKYIMADIFYKPNVRIEIYRPYVVYLNNAVFKIMLTTRVELKAPIEYISEQLENRNDMDGVDYIYDDF
ncbi:hypothetical protein C3K47_11935 [Solitalea longa]|uniref:Uncharacterized protein n=2 Tax=Solitalea longa TaxID=2079460 RepID=A0A2S5A1J8_9SPHI|nr:hypothetical protein C3K47_11935 [Solitalea longa]